MLTHYCPFSCGIYYNSVGNTFGEEGIELLRESLEAKGLVDFLGSLSDDEGLESEEEEEEEEEEGEGESEGAGEEGDLSREEEPLPAPKTDNGSPSIEQTTTVRQNSERKPQCNYSSQNG